jgi:stage II sporulation protein M
MRSKTKNRNFILENYRKSFNYLKESLNYIYVMIILFFIFALIGFFIPAPLVLHEKIMELIREILEQTKGMSLFELITFIFFNNLKVGILSVVLGILFGVVPIVFSISNGYLLGFVASITAKEEGILALWRILPHGIFELPAVFISLALGLKLGVWLFLDKKEKFSSNVLNTVRIFVSIVVPLLIIAALIEGILIFLSQ